MIKRIRSKLSVKVFLFTTILMIACSTITCTCIYHFAPYVYKYTLSDIEYLIYQFAEELSGYSREESPIFFDVCSNILYEQYDNEYSLHIFTSSGKELTLSDLDIPTGKRMEDFDTFQKTESTPIYFQDGTEQYFLIIAQNTDKQSQIVEALNKTIPILSVVILCTSTLAAFFYTWYMTAPVKKVSKLSRQMADMDFNGFCPTGRTDEIGVLSNSLNTLSQKLTAALSELQEANQKLQADIDKERQLERQRIEFFSAASHELKTPITIIKGQLQGMLYQVGRYKDRETYLAQSLEVTNTLEKMVQELLTISRLDTPGYTCKKSDIDFSKLINERLAAYEDLFMQKELTVEKSIIPGLYVSGDIQLLQNVIDNLLGNAATYSGAGNYISVKLWKEFEKVNLTIENTGVHIPDEDIPKLFEAFYRVDHSRNRQTGGTGLGLYIVKTILELHGAKIKIANSIQGVIVSIQF